MNKKNRFSMLEVDKDVKDKHLSKETINVPQAPIHTKKSIEIIVDKDEFKNNLEIHNLKNKEIEIQNKKTVLHSRIYEIKRDAWIKITIGLAIIFIATKKYIIGDEKLKNLNGNNYELIVTKSTLNNNDFILIGLIIIFIYFIFFKPGNKKKD